MTSTCAFPILSVCWRLPIMVNITCLARPGRWSSKGAGIRQIGWSLSPKRPYCILIFYHYGGGYLSNIANTSALFTTELTNCNQVQSDWSNRIIGDSNPGHCILDRMCSTTELTIFLFQLQPTLCFWSIQNFNLYLIHTRHVLTVFY